MQCTSRKLARVFGTTVRTVDRWVEGGLLRPDGEARYRYSTPDVLGCAIARDLRARGFSRETCAQAAGWIRNRSLDDLQEDWRQGRVYMFLIGEQPHFPRLFTHAEIFENVEVDVPAAL